MSNSTPNLDRISPQRPTEEIGRPSEGAGEEGKAAPPKFEGRQVAVGTPMGGVTTSVGGDVVSSVAGRSLPGRRVGLVERGALPLVPSSVLTVTPPAASLPPTDIFQAAAQGKVDDVRAMVRSGSDINAALQKSTDPIATITLRYVRDILSGPTIGSDKAYSIIRRAALGERVSKSDLLALETGFAKDPWALTESLSEAITIQSFLNKVDQDGAAAELRKLVAEFSRDPSSAEQLLSRAIADGRTYLVRLLNLAGVSLTKTPDLGAEIVRQVVNHKRWDLMRHLSAMGAVLTEMPDPGAGFVLQAAADYHREVTDVLSRIGEIVSNASSVNQAVLAGRWDNFLGRALPTTPLEMTDDQLECLPVSAAGDAIMEAMGALQDMGADYMKASRLAKLTGANFPVLREGVD